MNLLSSPVRSPYARFNLRRNPFGELTREERAELAVVDVAPWLDALRQPSTVVQFIGPKGSGKTTHLLAIERYLPAARYVYLLEDGPIPVIPLARPLLIDEAQRLSLRQRKTMFNAGGPLVLGTHEDLSREARRAGLEVVTEHVAAEHTPERLALILNRRIEASRISDATVPRIDIAHARDLMQNPALSIRDIEQSLYDNFQKAAQTGSPWPPVT
jgi:hypothetical protein